MSDFFPEGPNFENVSFRLKIQREIKNIVVLSLSPDIELELVTTNKFCYQTIKISLERGCTHFCICAINKGRFNLRLTFENRIFKQEFLNEKTLIFTEQATAVRPGLPALPFTLGDQAAISLAKIGFRYLPYDLATPLLSHNTKVLYMPYWIEFSGKKKLIPTCLVASEANNSHKDFL